MDKDPPSANLVLATMLQPSLCSWNEGPTKKAILDFLSRVTCKGGPDYVRRPERIAVFDDGGTLWPEKPMLFQAAFAIDRMKLLARQHARWTEAPLAHAILAGDLDKIATTKERYVQEIIALTHAGLKTDEFEKIVVGWLATARHPVLLRRYAELPYRPIQELMACLRVNGFKTFIVSSGGAEFVRALAEKMYGIPPEQVIASSIMTRLEFLVGKPQLVKQSRIEFIEDGVGKPSGIDRVIGRRPIFAIGNSDADHQMLQWVAANDRARLVGVLHHTDAVREFAYDRESNGGRLTKTLLEARASNWIVINMAKDWTCVFPNRESDSQ